MIMCFINEFCVKWSLNAFESRYGIYISDRWNVSSPVFSYVGNMMGEMSEIYLLLIRHEIGNNILFFIIPLVVVHYIEYWWNINSNIDNL